MKISGFTIARNVIKYDYPILESIQSILPICDEFVINVGDSEDDTLQLIQSIDSPKIRIIQTQWDLSEGKEVLSKQTNVALAECQGDWAFYLQSDEVIHEGDLHKLKRYMQQSLDEDIDALRFQWLHFYGSYYRYRVDHGWYQKQDRIVRNNGKIESYGDAYGFQRTDGQEMKRKNTGVLLYHYGWVHTGEMMTQRRVNAEQIGFTSLEEQERKAEYSYGDLKRFPAYFGSHPKVMRLKVGDHLISQQDKDMIDRDFWWHPLKQLGIRYKTGKRVKEPIV